MNDLTSRQRRTLLSVSIDIEALADKTAAPQFVASIKYDSCQAFVNCVRVMHLLFLPFQKCHFAYAGVWNSLEAIKENIFARLDIRRTWPMMRHLMHNICWRSLLFTFTYFPSQRVILLPLVTDVL